MLLQLIYNLKKYCTLLFPYLGIAVLVQAVEGSDEVTVHLSTGGIQVMFRCSAEGHVSMCLVVMGLLLDLMVF